MAIHSKPEITWDEMHASSSAEPSIPPLIHKALFGAIEHKQRMTLRLTTGVDLTAEPHVYGVRGGRPSLLVYLDDAHPPDWLLVDVMQIAQVELRDEHFEKRDLPAEFDPDRL